MSLVQGGLAAVQAGKLSVVYFQSRKTPIHESEVHEGLARRIARLMGLPFGGHPHAFWSSYVIPTDTLLGTAIAARLGIYGERDLFGGVVSRPFMATKVITHPLVAPDAVAPEGWVPAFPEAVRHVALPGFSVFSREDASVAGSRLLPLGPVRVKPAVGRGGRGQAVAHERAGLDRILVNFEAQDYAAGVVLEQDIHSAETLSVGQIRLSGHTASYFGRQHLTPDNAGHMVYGGTRLTLVRGGFEALLSADIPESARIAVRDAAVYDAAATDYLPDFFASRRNYDVVQGLTHEGARATGVLEQSWRIGGASAAEVAALEALAWSSETDRVEAFCSEVFGYNASIPTGATVLFRGEDPEVGFVTKFSMVEPYGHSERAD